MAEQPKQSEQPKKIGRFTIVDTLGIGGMGVVYLGKDPDIGRKVAIKVLHTTGDKEALERFKNEARTMGEISHPNIVILLEYGIDDSKPFLVMEYLDGLSLEKWIRQTHTLEEHKKVLLNLCSAINFAHRKEILHRDLKPGNVQVLPSGDAKLLDFGIATGEDVGLTATGFFIGTPKYLAPEILQDTTHTKSSDSYSLGLLAYTMLCGKNPFASETFEATMTRLLTKIPAPLNKINPSIPLELSNVIDSYLDKNPETRPKSPEKLRLALELISKPVILKKKIVPSTNPADLRSQEKTIMIGESPKSKTKWVALAILFGAMSMLGIFYKNYLERQTTIEQENNKIVKKESPIIVPDKLVFNKELHTVTDVPSKGKTLVSVEDVTEETDNDTDLIKEDPEVKKEEKIAEQKPQTKPTSKKPVEKPKTTPAKVVKTPVKKQQVVEEYKPTAIVYQKSKKQVKDRAIFQLPELRSHGSSKAKLITRSSTQIPRGRTQMIRVEITSGVSIDEFKVMRGFSEFNQVEIRKTKKLEDNRVELTLYAQTNATMGDFSLVGYYQNKKTKPLNLEVTL